LKPRGASLLKGDGRALFADLTRLDEIPSDRVQAAGLLSPLLQSHCVPVEKYLKLRVTKQPSIIGFLTNVLQPAKRL